MHRYRVGKIAEREWETPRVLADAIFWPSRPPARINDDPGKVQTYTLWNSDNCYASLYSQGDAGSAILFLRELLTIRAGE
jgi:hypothetical protein